MIEIRRFNAYTVTIYDDDCRIARFETTSNNIDALLRIQEEAKRYRAAGSRKDRRLPATLEKKLADLKNAKEIQCSPGNYDVDEYMRGMANGLILAQAIMDGSDPHYFNKTSVSPDEPVNELLPDGYADALKALYVERYKTGETEIGGKSYDTVFYDEATQLDLDKFEEACRPPKRIQGVKLSVENGKDKFEKLTTENFEIKPEPERQYRHVDDIAADKLSIAMREKLARKRAQGYGGWDNPDICSQEELSSMLLKHVFKGDPVDVANLCAFLHHRGESIKADGHLKVLADVFSAACDLALTKAQTSERQVALDRLRQLVCGA